MGDIKSVYESMCGFTLSERECGVFSIAYGIGLLNRESAQVNNKEIVTEWTKRREHFPFYAGLKDDIYLSYGSVRNVLLVIDEDTKIDINDCVGLFNGRITRSKLTETIRDAGNIKIGDSLTIEYEYETTKLV